MKQALTALILSTSALAGICASAQSAVQAPAKTKASHEAKGVQAQLVDEGVYETSSSADNLTILQPTPEKTGESTGLRLVNSTNTLTAKKGLSFGFRFMLKGALNGRVSGFEMFTSHPPMRGADGVVHSSQTSPIDITFENGVARDGNIYMLSEDFEVLPGKWTMAIRYQGKTLLSRKFELQ